MGFPMVSVIIPVYKAERFLDKCLESVICQDYPELEIILVDDGSPDSCPALCDWYAASYGFVKVIHKTNMGPGPARNDGLEAASGKYVAFVDSDDSLDGAGAIRLLVESAEEERADIVVGSFRWFSDQQIGDVCGHGFQSGTHVDTADFRLRGMVLSEHMISQCFKLYRRGFLADNGLKYGDYLLGEDHCFNMMCYACRPLYAFEDGSVYLRRADNGGSVSHGHVAGFGSLRIEVASDLAAFLAERGVEDRYGDLVAFYLCVGLYLVAKHELMHTGFMKAVEALSVYGSHPLVQDAAITLLRGRYIKGISSAGWRLMMWGVSLLCRLRAWPVLAAGAWLCQRSGLEKKFSAFAGGQAE